MIFRFIISFFVFFAVCFGDVLDVSKAFEVTHTQDSQNLEIRFKFGQDIYIYNDTFEVKLNGEKINSILNMPMAQDYGEYSIILQDFSLFVPFGLVKDRLKNDTARLEISYQGCAKNGICYRPQLKSYEIKKSGDKFTVHLFNKDKDAQKADISELSDDQRIAQALGTKGFWLSLATFFGYGLLLALTPCILPMIPILSSIIVAKGGNLGAKNGFLLSLVYVLAMSLAYAAIGAVASALGQGIGGALQNIWVLGAFSAIFVALALSMFGFFELRLPAKFENLISKKSQNGAGLIGVFVMGFAAALVVSPCVAAPLAGALLFIAQSGDVIYGSVMLFAMGFGMGVPLLAIGVSSGKILPRPGEWMDGVKRFFGFLMLAMAVWLLARVFGSGFELAGYGILGVFAAVYFGAFDVAISGISKFKKAAMILVFIYSVALMLGSMTGAKSVFAPLEGLKFANSSANAGELNFKNARNLTELKELIASAPNGVMVDFYADWCVSCKELEGITFKDANVAGKLANLTLIRVDVTQSSAQNDEMLREFSLIDPPALLFFKDGKEISAARVIGFLNPEKFLQKLQMLVP